MVTMKIHGGLGNQMFQYAMARAMSLRLGVDIRIDPSTLVDPTPKKWKTPRNYALSTVFNIDPQFNNFAKFEYAVRIPYFAIVFNKYYPRVLGKLGYWRYVKEQSEPFHPEIAAATGDLYFDGYWRTEKYFKEYADAIRKDFTFRHELEGETAKVAEDIKNSNSVCLHIRRGDNAISPVSQKTHMVAPMTYNERAFAMMKEKAGSEIKLFIFSDDTAWCRANLRFDVPYVFVGDEHAGVEARDHLHLMSLCKNFIIPESTFSWWAAWLATNPKKIVISPDKLFVHNRIDTRDMIPPEWYRISID
jgi:hypothetical protein